MKYETILFDLDGTLTDPALGITNSVMHALSKFGITVNDRKDLYPFIGPPLTDSFQAFYGFSPEEAKLGVTYYREYYADKGIFECTLHDGVVDLLQALRQNGCRLLVATSKPEIFARKILEYFDVAQYFHFIFGGDLDEKHVRKDEIIADALSSDPNIRTATTAMIGDRKFDMLGAHKFGLYAVGALYGYGSREELEQAGAHALAANVEELKGILL